MCLCVCLCAWHGVWVGPLLGAPVSPSCEASTLPPGPRAWDSGGDSYCVVWGETRRASGVTLVSEELEVGHGAGGAGRRATLPQSPP